MINTIDVNLFDGCLPQELKLETVPENIQGLIEEIVRVYPDRGQNLLEKSFSDDFIQSYSFFLNRVLVTSLDQKINPGDKIVILSSIAGG